MNERREKWKTWWWYHKVHVLIAVAAVAVALYSFLPGLLAAKPDCGVAVITNTRLPDETYEALKSRIQEVAADSNGDGKVLVELFWYLPDLSGETDGSMNYAEVSRLDADLVGKVSGIFLVEDTEGFQKNVVVPIADWVPAESIILFDGIPLPEGTGFTVRTDSDAQDIYEQVISYR